METVKVKFIHDMNQAKPQYRGLMHGMRTIIAQEGFRGCYKVNLAHLQFVKFADF